MSAVAGKSPQGTPATGTANASARPTLADAPPGFPPDFVHEGDEIPAPRAGVVETNTDADVTTDPAFESEPAQLLPPPLSDKTSSTVWSALAGNAFICALKAIVWWRSGSASMLAEAVHSLIDTANQALLALGLRQSMLRPDASHQFGYGKAAFVWSLMSALGMFWVGGGVSIAHGLHTMTSEAHALDLGWENWAVLGVSFLVDGTVLRMTLKELAARAREQFPEQYSSGGLVAKSRAIYRHMRHSSDPFLTAVALEDLSACAGVIIATAGIGLSQLYGIAAFDSGASVAIGGMLAAVSVALVRLNMKYLLGQSVDRATTDSISDIIRSFPSIDAVRYVHTQWLGPTTFLLSAKVDFDGTFLSASLHREYEDLFTATPNLQDDLPLILSFYAEDVTRVVEKELQDIEAAVRAKYPGAVLIQLEPDSQDSHTHIVKHMAEASRARDEEAEVHMHHMLVLQHLKRSRPGDPRIEVQERRITQWYQRRLEAAKSKAAQTGHPLPPTPAAHAPSAHSAAPTQQPQHRTDTPQA